MERPDALLLIAPGCPHCPAILEALADLVKTGEIGALEVVNAALRPERAQALGVRGVPWFRIGPFEFEGTMSRGALRNWAERATEPAGVTAYLKETLATGGLARAERLLAALPDPLPPLLALLDDPGLPMAVRLGTGALLEGLARSGALRRAIPQLGGLSRHPDHRVRADACHYLGLTQDEEAVPYLRERLSDENPEVREIAGESIGLALEGRERA